MNVLRRFHPLWWLLAALVLGGALLTVSGDARLALVGTLALFLIPEQSWLRRWWVNILAAARLLIDQEDHPGRHILPFVSHVDLYVITDTTSATPDQCVAIRLGWDNRSAWPVRIEHVRGTMRVGASDRRFSLPGDVADVELKPLERQENGVRIVIPITGSAWEAIAHYHQEKRGMVALSFTLLASVNGHAVQYREFTVTAYHVG